MFLIMALDAWQFAVLIHTCKFGNSNKCLYVFVMFFSYSEHEEAISELAKEMGFLHVSKSSQIMPMIRMVPRGFTGMYVCVYR